MDQGDIIRFLEERPEKWFSARELCGDGAPRGPVSIVMRRLREHDEVRYGKQSSETTGRRESIRSSGRAEDHKGVVRWAGRMSFISSGEIRRNGTR